ncbi:MAG TPA: reverse transcriptase domain-containing protein, partial [Fimbriimonadaceae bacterium]|nr:reverse transcriptase domain-containing protein [Fimbriimonadaceae bacterium]
MTGRYKPGAVRAVQIPKPNGGVRTLGIPNVLDRLIEQGIQQELSPLWETEFSEHSYGFRPGRNAHQAVSAAQGYVKAGKQWVVDIDLKSYFDEVNHDKLMARVSRKVRDKRLLRLIGDYLRAPMQTPDGKQQPRNKGTPQGGPLSPLLANIYLDPLDKELEKRGLAFVRYADDIAIFVSSERSAERVKQSVMEWIEKHLKVPVNREKSRSGP